MTFVLIAVLCLLTLIFVFSPFRAAKANSRPQIEYSKEENSASVSHLLLLEKQSALKRERAELEFDRTMDKLNSEDYEALRAKFEAESAAVAQQLSAETASADSGAPADFDIETEVLIARARRKRASQKSAASSAEMWTCSCGRSMSVVDKFCASCGAARPAVSSN